MKSTFQSNIDVMLYNLAWYTLFHTVNTYFPDIQAKLRSLHEQAEVRRDRLPDGYNQYMQSDAWRQRRKQIIAIYGGVCAACQSRKELHLHHRDYSEFRNESAKTCLPLCRLCHCFVHSQYPNRMPLEWFEDEYPAISLAFEDVMYYQRTSDMFEAERIANLSEGVLDA